MLHRVTPERIMDVASSAGNFKQNASSAGLYDGNIVHATITCMNVGYVRLYNTIGLRS